MFSKLRSHEDGFTLIELLVVILIIGVLAAIALPTFLGQQKKGQDATAKSDARNLVSHVESCFSERQTYATCTTPDAAGYGATTGLSIGTGAGSGKVEVTSGTATGFVIVGHSKSGNEFTITKTAGGAPVRSCTTVGSGGCKTGNW